MASASAAAEAISGLEFRHQQEQLENIHKIVPHSAALRLFQVHAVTEGTDAQAQVSVRLEEDGRIATGAAADTDTLTASAKAYVNALNRLLVRRDKSEGKDTKEISYKDVS